MAPSGRQALRRNTHRELNEPYVKQGGPDLNTLPGGEHLEPLHESAGRLEPKKRSHHPWQPFERLQALEQLLGGPGQHSLHTITFCPDRNTALAAPTIPFTQPKTAKSCQSNSPK